MDLINAVPYKIHTVLTDNGIQFVDLSKNRSETSFISRVHVFARVCIANGIEHRLTKIGHPWTNGQVERMNRTIKETTLYRYYYQSHEQLQGHLDTFLCAYNFAKRLKTLNGLTPYLFIVKSWAEKTDDFISDPTQFNLELYS